MVTLKNPPMGWNSYDYYDTAVTEADVKANADYMAKHLKEYGWEYVVVDIEWYAYGAGTRRDEHQYIPFSKLEMDEYSRLFPCTDRFPSSADGKGFKPLADYVHNLGLKFGIHIMRGIPRVATYQGTKVMGEDGTAITTASEVADPYSICYWNPDMYGLRPDKKESQCYYDSIVKLYAEWGVDFIKCDDICRMDAPSSKAEIEMLHKAIEKCGRDIVLSLSPGPALVEENEFYHENSNMWRITDDFWDEWRLLYDMFDRCKNWEGLKRDGGYPDCDMLALGKIGKVFGDERMTRFTKAEQRTMMTLWSLFGSPLILGADLPQLDEWTLSLLTNKAILGLLTSAVNPKEIARSPETITWSASAKEDDGIYFAIFNVSDDDCMINISDYSDSSTAVDLWNNAVYNADNTITIASHDVCIFKTNC